MTFAINLCLSVDSLHGPGLGVRVRSSSLLVLAPTLSHSGGGLVICLVVSSLFPMKPRLNDASLPSGYIARRVN